MVVSCGRFRMQIRTFVSPRARFPSLPFGGPRWPLTCGSTSLTADHSLSVWRTCWAGHLSSAWLDPISHWCREQKGAGNTSTATDPVSYPWRFLPVDRNAGGKNPGFLRFLREALCPKAGKLKKKVVSKLSTHVSKLATLGGSCQYTEKLRLNGFWRFLLEYREDDKILKSWRKRLFLKKNCAAEKLKKNCTITSEAFGALAIAIAWWVLPILQKSWRKTVS